MTTRRVSASALRRVLLRSALRILNAPRSSDVAWLDTYDPAFGASRGTPIDRRLIDAWLDRCAGNVSGSRSLEIAEVTYTNRLFPNMDHFILQYDPERPLVQSADMTISGDLCLTSRPYSGPPFDVIVATQVLSFVAEPLTALRSLISMLKPGGAIIGTEPLVSPVSRYDDERWGDRWRLTPTTLREALGDLRLTDREVVPIGNGRLAAGFILGLSAEEVAHESWQWEQPTHALITGYFGKR